MRKTVFAVAFLSGIFSFAQETKTDSTQTKDIAEVAIVAKKPTVETKVDRTVFNVANSSVLSGNTTWDVLRMTPLVSIDNNTSLKEPVANFFMILLYRNERKKTVRGTVS